MGFSRLKPGILGHLIIALAWLAFLAIANHQAARPVLSIFPYMVPVVFFAWVHGAKWGFFFAGLSALAALPADYIATHSKEDLLYAGFATYIQLSGAVIGCAAARMIREKAGRS